MRKRIFFPDAPRNQTLYGNHSPNGPPVGAAYMPPAAFRQRADNGKLAGRIYAAPTQMLAYYAIMVYRANQKRGYCL